MPSLARRPYTGPCIPRGVTSPDGRLVARCAGGDTEVFYTADGGVYGGFPGCAPAWRPDGVLTVTYRRDVVRFRLPCRGTVFCPVTLVRRTELERAARRHPTSPPRAPLRVVVDDVVWLSNTRAAVLLSVRLTGRFEGMGPLSAIALFENGRLTETQPFFRPTGGRLGVSPRATYLTQTPDVILRRDGSQVSLPPYVRDARAFAWSRDERFLALATRFAVTVESLERYDATGGGLRSVTIPQQAVDLTWR